LQDQNLTNLIKWYQLDSDPVTHWNQVRLDFFGQGACAFMPPSWHQFTLQRCSGQQQLCTLFQGTSRYLLTYYPSRETHPGDAGCQSNHNRHMVTSLCIHFRVKTIHNTVSAVRLPCPPRNASHLHSRMNSYTVSTILLSLFILSLCTIQSRTCSVPTRL